MTRHETINGQLKNLGILSQVFGHNMRHGAVFQACTVIAQLMIENNGEPLFEVESEDR